MLAARSLGVAFSLTALASLTSGCNKEAPPAAEEPRLASNAAAPPAASNAAAVPAGSAAPGDAAATPAAAVGAAKITDSSFDLSVEPKLALKAGQPGNVEVVLLAKPPFHVNDKYPIKLKLKETSGLKYPNLTLGKESVTLEPQRAVMPVAFTPERAGKYTVAGQFAFSVCTDDKCLMEKRDLALDVSVD